MSGVALVTGAGGGLGAEIARELAHTGLTILVHYHHNAAGARDTQVAIEASGGAAYCMQADLSDEAAARALAAAIDERFGSLDVLVNNVGVYTDARGIDLTETQWHEGIDTTASAVFFTTRACLPLLYRGQRKRVINIGDSSADRPGARDLAWSYHLGKTGVWMLTRSFATQEAAAGLAVNMVSPGILENSIGDIHLERIPAGRIGTLAEVAGVVRYLAIDAPSYLSGSNLVVSGGWNLR
jgi:NAD(P)-dependent dehydrogenase (short-subunit alcohol dehydrogenase family)